jgi:hypothetical protein
MLQYVHSETKRIEEPLSHIRIRLEETRKELKQCREMKTLQDRRVLAVTVCIVRKAGLDCDQRHRKRERPGVGGKGLSVQSILSLFSIVSIQPSFKLLVLIYPFTSLGLMKRRTKIKIWIRSFPSPA